MSGRYYRKPSTTNSAFEYKAPVLTIDEIANIMSCMNDTFRPRKTVLNKLGVRLTSSVYNVYVKGRFKKELVVTWSTNESTSTGNIYNCLYYRPLRFYYNEQKIINSTSDELEKLLNLYTAL